MLDKEGFLDGDFYTVRVEELFRGKIPKTIQEFSENSSGRFPMKIGAKYVLFVHRAQILGLWLIIAAIRLSCRKVLRPPPRCGSSRECNGKISRVVRRDQTPSLEPGV